MNFFWNKNMNGIGDNTGFQSWVEIRYVDLNVREGWVSKRKQMLMLPPWLSKVGNPNST